MQRIFKYIFFCIVISLHFDLFSQDNTFEKLRLKLLATKDDSTKVELLSELIEIAPEGSWEKYNFELNEITEKHVKYCASKLICDYYKKHYASSLVNLGYSCMQQGVSDRSISFYLKGLQIYEELNNVGGIAETNNNIAYVFLQQKNYTKAEEFYKRSLKTFQTINNKEGVASAFNNLGYVYKSQLKFPEALNSYNKGYKLYEEINDSLGLATSLNNIGKINLILSDTSASINCYKKSMLIFERKKDTEGLIYALHNLGLIYFYTNKLDEALSCANRSYSLAIELGLPESIRDVAKLKYDIFKKKNEPEGALKMHELFIKMRDSVLNENNHVSIIEQQLKYNHEKELLELEKQQVVSEAEKQKRNLIIYSIIILLIVVCVFSVSLFKKFKLTTKQKNTIEEQQKDIQDSINYAQRIQNSFMASETIFRENCSDHFILFKPKDVVSGDFYWANSDFDKLYLCVADSTGHGIPGAFMSLLNLSLLNEALLSRKLEDTHEILNFIRKILILGLKPDESGQGGNDGMDCCFVRIDLTKMELQMCGANNPLWIVRDNKLIELASNRMPVGRSPKQDIPFTSQIFSLKKNDILYLFTDGFADQFGGPQGKKFKYKQLNELLLANVNDPMNNQKEVLNSTIQKWKGSLEQVDDICIIGIKI